MSSGRPSTMSSSGVKSNSVPSISERLVGSSSAVGPEAAASRSHSSIATIYVRSPSTTAAAATARSPSASTINFRGVRAVKTRYQPQRPGALRKSGSLPDVPAGSTAIQPSRESTRSREVTVNGMIPVGGGSGAGSMYRSLSTDRSAAHVSSLSSRSAAEPASTPLLDNTPRTLYENLYQQKVTSRTAASTGGSGLHIPRDPHYRRYINLAGLSPRSTPVDPALTAVDGDPDSGEAAEYTTPRRSLTRRSSVTSVELDSVGRSSIVTNIKRIFEEKSRSASVPPRSRFASESQIDKTAERGRQLETTPRRGLPVRSASVTPSTSRTFSGIDLSSAAIVQPAREPLSVRYVAVVGTSKVDGDSKMRPNAAPAAAAAAGDLTVSRGLNPTSSSTCSSANSSSISSSSLILKNETDERKMAKSYTEVVNLKQTTSAELRPSANNLNNAVGQERGYTKRGWLQMQKSLPKDWQKCWCVLNSSSFTCFSDSNAESTGNFLLRVFLAQSMSVCEINLPNSFAFIILNDGNDQVFSAMTSGIRTSWIRAITKSIKESPSQSTVSATETPALPSTTMLTNSPGGHSWKSFNGEQQTSRVEHVKERLLPAVPTTSSLSVPIERGRTRPGQQQVVPRPGPSMGTTIRERVVGRRVRPVKSQQNETDSYDDVTPSSFSPRSTDELNSSSPSTPDLTSSQNSDTFHSSIYFQTNTASASSPKESLYVQTRPESWQNISPQLQRNWKSSPSTTVNNNTIIVNGENSTAHAVAGKDSIFTFSPNDNSPSPISSRHRSPSASRSRDQLWSPRQALSPSQNLLHTAGSSASIGSDLDSFLIPDEPASSVDDFLVSSLQAEVKVLQRQLQQATQTVQSQKQQLALQHNEQLPPDRRNSQTSTSPTARAYYASPLRTMNGHVSADTDVEFLREQNAKLAVELADTKRQLDKQTKLLETRLTEVGSLKQEMSASTTQNRELRNQLQKSELQLKTLKENAEREKRKVESELRQDHDRVVTAAERQLEKSQENARKLMEELKKKESLVSEMKEKLEEGEKIQSKLSAETDKRLQLSKELEKCKKDLEQMRNDLDLEKVNLNLERRKSSELEADVVHLRKEQMELAASLGLETKNQLLREDLERVEARLKSLQVENSKLVLEHSSCEKTIGGLRKELDTSSSELRSKENLTRKNVEKVELSMKELQEEFSSLSKEHSNCNDTIQGLQNKFDVVTNELKSKEKAVENAEKKLKVLEKEAERLKETARDSETLVKSMRSMLESINFELQYEKENCESQSRKAVESEEKLKQALKKIESMNCEIEAKDLELEMEAKNYCNYRVESQNKMKKLEDENAKLKELNAPKNDEKVVNPTTATTQSETARVGFFGHRKESVSSIKSYQLDEVDELKKKVKELTDECQATKDELKLMSNEKEELEKSIEEAKKEIDKSSRELAAAREQLRCQEIDRVVSSNPEIGKEQDWTMPEGLGELKSRYSLAVRQLRALQREAQWAESRRVDIEKANVALKRELRNMEVEREKRTGQLETKVKEMGMKLEAAERRNRRLELNCKPSDSSDVSRSDKQADTNGINNNAENKQPIMELSLTNDVTASPSSDKRILQLESRLQTMEAEYEQQITALKAEHKKTLVQCKEETVKQLAASDISSFQIDEESIRRKYSKDTEHIKDIYDKGFGAMERSHQRTMMEMRRTHKNELDKLRQEKDQLLKEEAQATQAVLDAMRKAHEVELEKERGKLLDLLAKTYCQADMESLQRQHEEDLELIQREICQLSEQYSVKCLENAALTERLEAQAKAMHSNCLRVHELTSRNDELSTSFKYELERLGRMVEQQSLNLSTEKEHEPKQLYMTLQLKEAELQQLQQELTNLRRQMNINTEELQESRQMYNKLQTLMHDNNLTNGHDSMVNGLDSTDTSLDRSSILRGSFGGLEPSDASLDDAALLNKLATCRRSSSNAFRMLLSAGIHGERSVDGTCSPRDSGRRRLSWRLKNPQRARTSPDVSTASLRSHSVDVESSCDGHDSLVTSRDSTPRCSRMSSGSESDFASTAF